MVKSRYLTDVPSARPLVGPWFAEPRRRFNECVEIEATQSSRGSFPVLSTTRGGCIVVFARILAQVGGYKGFRFPLLLSTSPLPFPSFPILLCTQSLLVLPPQSSQRRPFKVTLSPEKMASSSSSSGLAAAAAAAKAEAAAEKESYRGIWIPCALDEAGLKNVEKEGLLVADD